MRKAEIKQIDVSQYKGNVGDALEIKIQKKDFMVNKVEVTLLDETGKVIESGSANKKHQDVFFYKAQQTLQEKLPVTIRVVVCDHVCNEVRREMLVTSHQ
jgi:hypothetical protein